MTVSVIKSSTRHLYPVFYLGFGISGIQQYRDNKLLTLLQFVKLFMAYCSPGFLDDHHFDRRLHLRTTAVLLLSLPLFSVSYTRISELVYTAVEI